MFLYFLLKQVADDHVIFGKRGNLCFNTQISQIVAAEFTGQIFNRFLIKLVSTGREIRFLLLQFLLFGHCLFDLFINFLELCFLLFLNLFQWWNTIFLSGLGIQCFQHFILLFSLFPDLVGMLPQPLGNFL